MDIGLVGGFYASGLGYNASYYTPISGRGIYFQTYVINGEYTMDGNYYDISSIL